MFKNRARSRKVLETFLEFIFLSAHRILKIKTAFPNEKVEEPMRLFDASILLPVKAKRSKHGGSVLKASKRSSNTYFREPWKTIYSIATWPIKHCEERRG